MTSDPDLAPLLPSTRTATPDEKDQGPIHPFDPRSNPPLPPNMLFAARRLLLHRASPAAGLFRPAGRLQSTLAILEQRDGQLNHGSLSAFTAAKQLGGAVHGFIAGRSVSAAAAEAARVDGIENIIAVENEAYEKVASTPTHDLCFGCRQTGSWLRRTRLICFAHIHQALPESYAPLLVENIKKGNYTHVIAGHTAFGKNVLPRVAALLDSQQISDVTSIQDDKTFVRPIYAGNAIATVESSDAIKILTIRGTAFAPAPIESGSAAVVQGADPKAASTTEWVSEDLAKSDRPDLAKIGRAHV